MATTIESLELQISDNSEQASKGLNNLAASLEKLKTVSSGLRMTTCANQISKIGSATSTPVSYTHLDVYKRQSILQPTITRLKMVR